MEFFFICGVVLMVLAQVIPAWSGGELQVAVASNFLETARDLSDRFSNRTGIRILLSPGSTGRHYAQIRNGAPFDLFLAADAQRPRLLEEQGRAVAGTRFTYAQGVLVLWSPKPGLVDDQGRVLTGSGFTHLALANPKLAPYGAAARQVLIQLGQWDRLAPGLIQGESVAQVVQFLRSGSVDIGFVALSQLRTSRGDQSGSMWRVPASLYEPIQQQAILIRESEPGRLFLGYLHGKSARAVIRSHGYTVP